MHFVRTVAGDIAPETLGHCQCHEHLFIAKGQSYLLNPALWMDDVDASAEEAARYHGAGGRALVDAQPTGAGSMPLGLLEVSRRTSVNIIASTGFHKLCFYKDNHWLRTSDEDTLARYFALDVQEGLSTAGEDNLPAGRCEARAGVIKCALDEHGLSQEYQKLFRAAAAASNTTGAPLLIHTEDGLHALELVELLTSLGVAAPRIILCHMERSLERMEDKLRIAQTGVFIQCDTIARFKYHSDEDEARFLGTLCERGHEGQLLLGLDTTRTRLTSYGGATGLDYILTTFLPLLLQHGFTSAQLQRFCVTNPANALIFQKKGE